MPVSDKTRIIAALIVLIFALMGINAALTLGMIEAAKESHITGNVMQSAVTGEPVQVASSDFKISGGGRLTGRVANATAESLSASSSVNRGGGLVTVTAEAAKYEMKLESCMPNSFWSELKTFVIKQTAVYMELDVHGFVRMPRANSLYGTAIILITTIGRITVDGETLSFTDDVGAIFAEAGFNMDKKGRRLMGLLDIVGFFNAIPAEKYACYVPSEDGPKPTFPGSFMAKVTNYQVCDHPMQAALGMKKPCANLTDAEEATLETLAEQRPGVKFVKSEGYQLVSDEAKFSLET
jgi:hypothetical protein